MEYSRARRAGFPLALLACLPLLAAASPSITDIRVTDCEGNLQSSLSTSTGTPIVQVTVQDTFSGLRIGRAEHTGGVAARGGTRLLLHLDGTFVDSSTFNHSIVNSGTTD